MNRPTWSIVWRAVLGCLLLNLPGPITADEPIEIPTTIGGDPADTSEMRTVAQEVDIVEQDGRASLRLEQAIALALQRNLTLVVQRHTRSQSIFAIEQNEGIYDVNLQATGGFGEDTSPRSSALQETGGANLVTEGQQLNLQATRLLPQGGTAQIDFNNSRGASSDRTAFFNPSYTVGFDMTFTQPVLRDFGRSATERNLIVARTDAAISREDFRAQVEAIVQQASDTYWALVESREQLKVAEESLGLAEELYRMNKIQVEVGTLAPLEVVSSEAGVASRRQSIIRFRAQVEDNADELRRLVNLDRGALWDVELVPATDPEVAHQPIDVELAMKTALENRADISRRRLQNETLELDAKVARNQKKPRLDLSATFGYNALDGNLRNPDTGNIIALGDYFDALAQISDRSFDGWNIGFTFAYPLQNRTAEALSASADLAVNQGEYQLRDLELQILTEVRGAARAVETAAEEIESAKVSSRLQEQNLDAEEKRYENGLSTSFQVLQVQEDLSEARQAEVSAVIGYRRAETAFYRAIGKLLDQYDVVLSDDIEVDVE